MKKEIIELQDYMYDEGIDAYYVPSSDPHGSEYVNPHYQSCEFLSGLTSEAADLLVTSDSAYIWTDGRFFLQAERQLPGSGIELMKSGQEGVPTLMEFLRSKYEEHSRTHEREYVIGMDGNVVPASWGRELEKTFGDVYNVRIKWDEDLAGKVWKDRPHIEPSKIWELPLSSAGMSAADKITHVRAAMGDKGADCLLISDLMESAWLFNLRGGDIEYTPVFFSYVILTQDKCILYVMDDALGSWADTANGLPEGLEFVEVRNYSDIYDDVAAMPREWKIWMDTRSASYSLYLSVPDADNIIDELTPVALAKTVKNETEIASTINAHIKDGVAVTRFIRWIKETAAIDPQTEISAADYLEARRREMDGCFDLSFETISGYGPDGAIIHYAPTPETDLAIRPEGFLLVDSGGQYIDGTTDITRTIAVGPLTQEMIDGYTRVLKGHIALSRYVITPETTYKELDGCTRSSLQEAGLDFLHGVSHGVGHVLAVHEGPAGIRKGDEPHRLKPGMIMSNEPGLYMGGEYGIRIENEILLRDNGEGCLVSDPITVVPYEREAVNTDLLTDEELRWLNDYHSMVREKLMPYMSGADAEFVMSQTEPVTR